MAPCNSKLHRMHIVPLSKENFIKKNKISAPKKKGLGDDSLDVRRDHRREQMFLFLAANFFLDVAQIADLRHLESTDNKQFE